jgi:predicted ribosome quality control (RQC) complex YloA/Tae2 family protein
MRQLISMKSYSLVELRTFVQQLRSLIGAQLQEVRAHELGLSLGFWNKNMTWLVLDMSKACPLALIFDDNDPLEKAKKTKPLGLFIHSHLENKKLSDCEMSDNFGRVFTLILSRHEVEAYLEISLIPHRPNITAMINGKKISWNKPFKIEAQESTEVHDGLVWQPRDLNLVKAQWLEKQKASPSKTKAPKAIDPGLAWQQKKQIDLGKKQKAIEGLEQSASLREQAEWSKRGESLKSGLGELVDSSQSLAWNIEHCFKKAKQLKEKWRGQQARIEVLRQEIQELSAQEYTLDANKNTNKNQDSMLKLASARGRTLKLNSGVEAYCGKNAIDNLALLRKARAWDLWLHLSDYPGAHVIVRREKQQNLSDLELFQIAEWLVAETIGKKKKITGAQFGFIVAECRYIKPIKGDKLGRVVYKNEKRLLLRCKT